MSENLSIVSYAVYPSIGIARVGNSDSEWFIGPEAPGQVPNPCGGFKDPQGRIKRQAARFRIYGLNADGEAVQEITAADAEIEWRVHVANRKAGWYMFQNAMDLGSQAKTSQRRNSGVTGENRKALVIDPGSRKISGKDEKGKKEYKFDTGTFMGFNVPLGELQTDSEGRLLVLGGFGHSASTFGAPATTFANNNGWHDDVSDGPVRATVKIGGKTYEAEPAMVAVTPPNYGPGLYGVVTMYDVVYNLFCTDAKFGLKAPVKPSFWRDIYPIFKRLVDSQWVNSGIGFLFGQFTMKNFTSPDWVAKLSDPSPAQKPVREAIFEWFRTPGNEKYEPVKLPPFYGDAFGDYENVGNDDLSLTPTQYEWLKQWAEGNFDTEPYNPPKTLEEYPVKEQPLAVTRTNLEECLGGPFHPGIEITWPMRVASMWKEAFRLNILPEGEEPKMDYGDELTPEVALAPGGVVDTSGPGTLTWWLGVPWQTDGASCMSGYDPATYLMLPSFWAARVPNQVMSNRSYSRVMDENLSTNLRLMHFSYRQEWLRVFGPAYQTRINDNAKEWHKLAIVTEQPGPSDSKETGFPSSMWVETGLDEQFVKGDATWQQVLIAEECIKSEEKKKHPVMAMASLQAEVAEIETTPRRVRRRDER